MTRNSPTRTWFILGISIALVVLVTWFVPSLTAAALNLLFRVRGELRAPDDLVVLAIDDLSLQRIGQWPWPRSVMAEALDKLTDARVRCVGLDVIYAEPSTPPEDQRLAAAVARNGRVVLPAQLYGGAEGATWLRPLPEFAAAARALGHAHVSPGVDGMVRSIQLSKADDRAARMWAFGLEAVRVAQGIGADAEEERDGQLRLGAYHIPVRAEAATSTPGVTVIRPNEMQINFIGPARSFRYYSIADLLAGEIPATALTNKIVLIGAVAESMGDTRVAPFMHYSAASNQKGQSGQGGQEMPGVEIHANIINTIRQNLSLRPLPDWLEFAAALLVIAGAALAIRWLDGWRQLAALGLLFFTILCGSYLAFSRYLIIPPLVPMVTGLVAVIPLLLNRTLAASRELDVKLAALVSSQQGFLSTATQPETEFADRALPLDLPQSLAWKLRAVDDLTARLLARMNFVNRILTSMGEGVLVADLSGQVVFANREATELFGGDAAKLMGTQLAELLLRGGRLDEGRLRAALADVTRWPPLQLEFEVNGAEPRHYSLLLSALATDRATDESAGEEASRTHNTPANIIGVVALLSDITKRVELDRMKTETLQLISHELRTPLTSIQGLSDVLLKFPVPAAETREMLTTIHSEAVRLRETITRYLDLTRLEAGAQPLRLTEIPCARLLADCAHSLSPLAAERAITLTTRVEPALPALRVDVQLFTQAISNLLSNAIKYSPPQSEIFITAARAGTATLLSVRDQGHGIPEAARERIFEKFYRLERDAASGVVGTGLGLPLAREIVERHGGQISVTSEARGTTFTIRLPQTPPQP